MKKITLSFIFVLCGFLFVSAQSTLEVGADKTYTTILAAWDAAKSDPNPIVTINVAEGTYVETADLTGTAVAPATATMNDKKIKIIGAGADKTIVKRYAGTDFTMTNTLINPGRLFQLTVANQSNNLELTLEKMTIQTTGFTNTNGGGVINATQTGQKFAFKDCNFKNIFARAGAVIQATTAVSEVKFENCFFEECGSFDNNSHEGLIKVNSGTLSLTNCTFYNNSFDVINRGATATGTDRNIKNGQLVTIAGSVSSFNMSDCYLIGNKYINGDATKVHPLISMKPATTGTAPSVLLTNAAPGFNILNSISVGNVRADIADCDLYYNLLSVPTAASSVMNSVKNFDPNASPAADADLTTMDGMTISSFAAISSYFEMDGEAPKIVTNSLGVKSLVRKAAGVKNVNRNNLKVNVIDCKITISSDKPENIEIYNSIGAKVGQFLNTNHVQTRLSNGIYIVKNSTFSTTVLVR